MFSLGFVGCFNCDVEYGNNSLGSRDCEREYLQACRTCGLLVAGKSFAMVAGEEFEHTFMFKLEQALRASDDMSEMVKAGIGVYGLAMS